MLVCLSKLTRPEPHRVGVHQLMNRGVTCVLFGSLKINLIAAFWINWIVILLMKNVAKLSAVRVDEGGGGGGQRREENVLKSMRELGELLILS